MPLSTKDSSSRIYNYLASQVVENQIPNTVKQENASRSESELNSFSLSKKENNLKTHLLLKKATETKANQILMEGSS